MAIFTFSTKAKRPEDTELVKSVKERYEREDRNFSAYIVELIKEAERGREVSDNKSSS